MTRARSSVVAICALLLLTLSACSDARELAQQSFQPAASGTLTVATSLPAPGFWNGADVTSLTGGLEYEIAVRLADRFGLELTVIELPFEQIAAGDLGGADLALAQITVTAKRDKVLTFSVPYYIDDAGVVVASGTSISDLKTAREQSWAVARGTIEEQILSDDIRPDDEPAVFEDASACIEAVAAGVADAALVDLSTALLLTKGRSDLTTGGRVIVNGEIAAAMPKNVTEGNRQAVDAALRAMTADGTLNSLVEDNLTKIFEQRPDSIPVIRTS